MIKEHYAVYKCRNCPEKPHVRIYPDNRSSDFGVALEMIHKSPLWPHACSGGKVPYTGIADLVCVYSKEV